MKKIFPVFMSFFLASVSVGFAEEAQMIHQRLCERPNRIYLGPEYLFFQVDTHVKEIHVEGDRSFWGLRLGYEYLKPQAFYGAAELFALNSGHGFSVSSPDVFYRGKGSAGFGSIQTRFGYAFSSSRALFTPFLGLGIYALSKHVHNGFEESFGYLAGGLRSQFECASFCSIGLNAEIFRSLGVRQLVKLGSEKTVRHTNGWGCNVGLPVTVRLSRGWDLQIVPYFLRLLFAETQNGIGASLLFSYRF